MLGLIKKYWWVIVIGVGIILLTVLGDISRIEELKSLLRRKKVEDDVLVIKEAIAKKEGEVALTEEQLLQLAEAHQEEIGKAKDATEDEIHDFYKKFFNK